MAVPTAAALRFRPMTEADLPGVDAIEQDVQPFSWGPGQFGGALDAGYTAWVFEAQGSGEAFSTATVLAADLARDTGTGSGPASGSVEGSAAGPDARLSASAAPAPLCGYAILMGVLDEWELLTLALARSHQGRGLGRQALEGLLAHAQQQGARCVFLEVAAGNAAARALYERAGFVTVGERRRYYRSRDGRTDDALVMRLDLGSRMPASSGPDAVPPQGAAGKAA